MKEYAKTFYKSVAWKTCRTNYAAYRHNLCEICMKRGIFKPGEIVHHKVHITPDNINDPRVTLDWKNLQCLCRDCHAEVHKEKKRYTVNEYGKVTATE